MSTFMKPGQPWLYDDTTGDIIGVRDADGGDSFFARTQTNATTGATELLGPDGRIIPYVRVGEQRLLKSGQPFGITRPVKSPGKLVARFVDAEITVNNGTPAHADHTGYDAASGVETGVVSITGQPNLLKITPAADTTEGIRFTTFATSVVTPQLVDGKFGLWLYVEGQPGYETSGTVAGTIKVVITTEAGESTTNALQIVWNANQVREGWNFLTFIMRVPTAYVDGSGVSEYHPYGVLATNFGTGADTDILNNPMTKIIVQWDSMYDAVTPCTLYLDSIWTGWETECQVVFGCDAIGTDLVTYALPIFHNYGWVGYVATPARVYSAGSTILADYTGASSWASLEAHGQTIQDAGWDCINHTVNHRQLGTLSAAEIAYEVLGVQPVYSAAGWMQGNEFYASPQSSSSRLSQAVIENCGIKLQRHIRKSNVEVTPWGVDNIHHVGASGVGSNVNAGYSVTTSGGQTSVTGLQQNSKLRILTDAMIAYGASWFPFWHNITELGDTGSGEDLTGDDLYITLSAFTKWLEYVREKELAGALRVCRGMTGFYYGKD